MKRIMLYGTGKLAAYFMEQNEKNYEIAGFVETERHSDTAFGKYAVYAVDEIDAQDDNEYFMTNTYTETLYKLLQKGIAKERITILSWGMAKEYGRRNDGVIDIRVDADVADGFAAWENPPIQAKEKKYVITKRMNQDQVTYGETGRGDFYIAFDNADVIRNDEYARVGVLTLTAREIEQRNVRGDVAELGVYKGDFAQYINQVFPERRLFLMDTFEGFVSEELEHDITQGFLEKTNYFNSVDDFTNKEIGIVMEKMRYPARCEVIQGRFPESLPEDMSDKIFAFVSIDCDLYLPILEGLRYFYPRLAPGGYMMIHDYSNLPGVRQAVYDYETEQGFLAKVPITDACGSLVVTRQ